MPFSLRRMLGGSGLFLLAIVAWAGSARAAEPPPSSLAVGQELPPIKLRGYGVLSATLREATSRPSDARDASALEIKCETDDKARLVQAKFLSDLEALTGVSRAELATSIGNVAARRVAGQGDIAAIRAGDRVFILAANTDAGLIALVNSQLPPGADARESDATTKVPMYLDRWDRYGFRFYYAPWMRPHLPNGRDDEAYDPLNDFKFARASGTSGIVLWNSPDSVTTAEGITNVPNWDWALRSAAALGLPIGINFDMGEARWIFNRYPEQVIQRAPQYTGTWYGILNYGVSDILSWASPLAQDVQFAQMQKVMRTVMPYADQITSWLEMHGELSHPPCDMLVDYGPDADRSYQRFLKTKYRSVADVSRAYGPEKPYTAWDQVRAPEVADFYGWAADAIDLKGTWKISYEAPFDPASAAVTLDDSKWPSLTAPGDQIVALLPHKPAVFRRTIQVDAAWHAAHPKVWLYLWDLNDTRPRDKELHDTLAYLNGKLIVEPRPRREEGHWTALDVSSALVDGENSVTLMLPQGCLLYRTYFAPHPPLEYPNLGPSLNQRWADFADWIAWTRAQTVRRGAQAIRQIDPNRQIVFMSPTDYAAGVKRSCQDYGGLFHDTGAMAGFWTDENVMQMSAAGLPDDCEPGGGAVDEADFKRFMGRWITEGTQGVDYFIHIGDVLWKPDIKQYFDQSQHLWHLIGKYHCPPAQVALLTSDRVMRLIAFPWGYDPNTVLGGGHWQWRIADLLRENYTRDMLDESDFESGDFPLAADAGANRADLPTPHNNAAKYRVIIDSNTTIIDPPLLDGIERYVRNGGIFVTYVQTGRHTSAIKDSWPISKLSGYAVTRIDPYDIQGNPLANREVHRAAGQDIFGGDWEKVGNANGLTLKAQAPDCQDLLLWPDGTVAAGMRRVGKGAIIDLGLKFVGDAGNGGDTARMLEAILRWARIPRTPATATHVLMSHFISNNGLYDVWPMFNQSPREVRADITFRDGFSPASYTEITAPPLRTVELVGKDKIIGLSFGPWETRVILTPHQQIAAAPLQWLQLQRSWWRGTADAGAPIPPLEQKLALDLTDGWKLMPLDDKAEVMPLVKPDLDDSHWEDSPLRIVSVAELQGIRRAIFRRRFRVPKNWNAGSVKFWCQDAGQHSLHDAGRLFIDGREAWDGRGDGPSDLGFDGLLRPDSEHTIAIEVTGTRSLVGVVCGAWLSYVPDATDFLSLAGDWQTSDDPLRFEKTEHLPGPCHGAFARRQIAIPASARGRNIVFHVLTEELNVRALLVNGRYIQRTNPYMGKTADFNITPYVKFGEANDLMLIQTTPGRVRELTVNYYEKGEYP